MLITAGIYDGRNGTNSHFARQQALRPNVRIGSEADICAAKSDVRFAPNSDRKSGHPQPSCLLYPRKADTCSALAYVCFGPIADISSPYVNAKAVSHSFW